MDKGEALDLLAELREKAYRLAAAPEKDDDFKRWHQRVVESLKEIFGKQSQEVQEFERIDFALRPETRSTLQAKLRRALKQRYNVTLPANFEIPGEKYYRDNLIEAAELLLAFQLQLKSSH